MRSRASAGGADRRRDARAAGVGRGRRADEPRPRVPALDDACAVDGDCVLFADEIADSPPHTYACCPGCTQRAASRAWRARFQAACQATPPPMCPPLGCVMPLLRAVCQAGRCAAVK